MRTSQRSLALSAAAVLAVLAGGIAVAAPAQADTAVTCTDTSTPDGSISGCMAAERAMYWVNANNGNGVIYDQSATFNSPDGVPYRSDCSGFVSMALHLTPTGLDAFVTGDMYEANGFQDVAKDNLQQGDILDNPSAGDAGHVVLFDHWTDSTHTSYWGFEQHGPSGSYGTSYHVIPYPYFSGSGTYYPQHYTKLAPPAVPAVYGQGTGGRIAAGVHADSRVEVFAVTPAGGIENKYETSPDGTWSAWNGFGPAGTAVAVATGRHADGRLEVFAVMSDGSIMNRYETAPDKAWSDWYSFAPAGTAKSATVGVHQDGRLEVFAVTPSGGLQNKYETAPEKAWSGWNGFGPAGTVDAVTASQHADGRLEVFAVMSDGSMQNKYESAPEKAWSSWNGYAPAGTANGKGSPGTDSSGVHQDGRMEVFAVTPSGGIENKYETAADKPWTGWNGFGPAGVVTATTVTQHQDGRLEVFAVMSDGSIQNKYETKADAAWSGWSSYAPAATAKP
ncbi:hypothetical protein [Catenulispora pinisilvae]|uniref:hypothetical protein n=1 Tax=Catenulispora pinisilvae TaxID=2705253 RepID=UPI001891EF0B|nr:hypothetical protein [Catenulispora pinisilvae]